MWPLPRHSYIRTTVYHLIFAFPSYCGQSDSTLQQLHHVFRLLLWSLQLQTLRDMGNRKVATEEEKRFMFMWSRAVRACCLGFADYKMPDMCYRFTIDHREFLRKEEYRMSFAFHLSNLFNFRLIPPDVVSNCLRAVEDDAFYQTLKNVGICAHYQINSVHKWEACGQSILYLLLVEIYSCLFA